MFAIESYLSPLDTSGGAWAGPTDQLTHRWPMDDANVSGTTITDVVGTLHGTAHGGISSASGPVTQARSCDGAAGSYISFSSAPLPSFITGGGAWSVAAWYYLDDITASGSGGSRATFASFTAAGGAGVDEFRILNNTSVGNGFLSFGFISAEVAPNSANMANNTWVSVVLTNDGSGGRVMYVNGSSVSIQTPSTGASGNGFNQFFGYTSNDGIPAGRLYQCATWTKVLSGAEALQYHNAL